MEREKTGRKVTLTFEWYFPDKMWDNVPDKDLIDVAYADIYEGENGASEERVDSYVGEKVEKYGND